MKLTASSFRIVASLLLVGTACTFSTARAAEAGNALVRAVSGKASYSKDGAAFKPLRTNMKLPAGSVVRTEAGAKVDMVIDTDKSVVRVEESTQLGLDKLSYEEGAIERIVDTDMNLPEGEILGNVKKIAAASKYQVKTPNGVAAIRGTEYRVRSNGQVTVTTGRVTVTLTRTYTNPAGQVQQVTIQVNVEAGQTFTPPPQTAAGTAQLIALAQNNQGQTLVTTTPPGDVPPPVPPTFVPPVSDTIVVEVPPPFVSPTAGEE